MDTNQIYGYHIYEPTSNNHSNSVNEKKQRMKPSREEREKWKYIKNSIQWKNNKRI